MAFGAPNKKPENAPRVISLKLSDNFYEEFQRQLEEAVSSMTPDQIFATLLILLGIELLSRVQGESAPETLQDETSFIWNTLSGLQKELPEGKTLGDLLDEANFELVINDQPVDLKRFSKPADDDPFENFKRGWDDAMSGQTMSFEEFERRMLEDAD